jgi:hypothetical protein
VSDPLVAIIMSTGVMIPVCGGGHRAGISPTFLNVCMQLEEGVTDVGCVHC